MFNFFKSHSYEPKDNNRDMFEVAKEIIDNYKEVEVHGNKFRFRKNRELEKSGKLELEINGVKTTACRFGEGIYVKNGNINGDSGFNFNFNGDNFRVESVFLNFDFSVRDIKVKGKKIHPCLNLKNQNFYIFDKNNNISGVKQQITVELNEYLGRYTSSYAKLTSEAKAKLNLLNDINILLRDGYSEKYLLTFSKDYAYVLSDQNLFFYKRKRGKYEQNYLIFYPKFFKKGERIENNEDTFITVFGGKIFLTFGFSIPVNDTLVEEKVILVFNQKTKQLEANINLKKHEKESEKLIKKCENAFDSTFYSNLELREYLSMLNTKNCKPHCSKKGFYIELKKYFDSCVKMEKNKKISKYVSENLEKTKKKEDKICVIY